MPLFGRRKRKEQEAPEQAERAEMQEIIDHHLTVRRLRLSGQIDITVTPTDAMTDEEVHEFLTGVLRSWPMIPAFTWRGYELLGRGCWWMDIDRGHTGYSPEALFDLPEATRAYCQAYNPLSDLVMQFSRFDIDDLSEAAAVWVRSGDLLITPASAWRHLDPVWQDRIETKLRPMLSP